MIASGRLRTGIFIPPHHPNDEDPTLAIQRDFELVEWLDKLGYDEAWVGEHHSAGYEIISSPEVFIAAAAERTKRIMLGTGVVSLPYHHPLMVAGRIIQLDHQTRGRVMFGIGPGLLTSDAMMLGIDPDKQRQRMNEAIGIILRLFAGETVTYEGEWFTLREARLHLKPYTQPHPHVAVASAMTPSGATLAGKHGLGMLCVAASNPAGYDVLDTNWEAANKSAAAAGRTMNRSDLRLVAPFYIAETREKALADVRWGWDKFKYYNNQVAPGGGGIFGGSIEDMVERHAACIGTPDDAVAFMQRYWNKVGGFGAMLHIAINWARFEDMKRSYELFMRYVMPKFAGYNEWREASLDWLKEHAVEFGNKRVGAAQKAIDQYFGKEPREAKR
ncbi:MAG TPA: LLM class flavin-dependent oxidoreductase [Xanthobacteraceae bacterium]|nr:LLM class flavin-dependent oxidoreductase [Xanthobacteraceae bacterium]